MQRDPWLRALIVLGVAIAAIYLAGQLWQLALHFGDIIVIFFLAWLLAFTLRPFVRLMLWVPHLPRVVAVGIVYALLLVTIGLVVVLVVPLAVAQFIDFATALPDYAAEVPRLAGQVEAYLHARRIPVTLPTVLESPGLGAQAERVLTGLLDGTFAVIGGFASVVVAFTIILVLSFYFSLDGERLLEGILGAVPEPYETEARLFFVSIGHAFGGYLRGTLILMGIFVVGTAAVMAVAQLPYLLLISVLAGILVIVPFVGPTLAILPPILIAAITLSSWSGVVTVAIALLVLQIVSVNVILPKVMGDSVGLHPLVVFLALLVGAKQAGLAGAIFGVPIAAVLYATGLILLQRLLPERPAGEIARGQREAVTAVHVDRLARLRSSVGGAFRRRFSDRVEQGNVTAGEEV